MQVVRLCNVNGNFATVMNEVNRTQPDFLNGRPRLLRMCTA